MFFQTDLLCLIPFQMFLSPGMIYFKEKRSQDISKPFEPKNVVGILFSAHFLLTSWVFYTSWIFLSVMASRRQLELRRKLGTFPSEYFVIVKSFEGRSQFTFCFDRLSVVYQELRIKLDKMKLSKLSSSQVSGESGEKSSQNQNQNQPQDLEKAGNEKTGTNGEKSSSIKIELIRRLRLAIFYILYFFAGVLLLYLSLTLVDILMGSELRLKVLSWDVLSGTDQLFLLCCIVLVPWTGWIFTIYFDNQRQLKRILERHQNEYENELQKGAPEKYHDHDNDNEENNKEETTETVSHVIKVKVTVL